MATNQLKPQLIPIASSEQLLSLLPPFIFEARPFQLLLFIFEVLIQPQEHLIIIF